MCRLQPRFEQAGTGTPQLPWPETQLGYFRFTAIRPAVPRPPLPVRHANQRCPANTHTLVPIAESDSPLGPKLLK
jgi:hypothetical protein